MSQNNSILNNDAIELRKEFDNSFAHLAGTREISELNFLHIRLGDKSFALQATDLTGIYLDHRVMPMPSKALGLIGVAGFRGQIAPVYDLAVMLEQTVKLVPRWLVLVKGASPVAIAFERFEGYFSAPISDVIGASSQVGEVRQNNSFDVVRSELGTFPIVHVPSLLKSIEFLSQPSTKLRTH